MMNHRTVKRLIQLELQGDLLAQVDEFAAVRLEPCKRN